MCPLRILLIFLSATLAGFFVLRNLKTAPEDAIQEPDEKEELPLSTKVGSAIRSGFWTCVDMASGRYLWRNFISPDSSQKKC